MAPSWDIIGPEGKLSLYMITVGNKSRTISLSLITMAEKGNTFKVAPANEEHVELVDRMKSLFETDDESTMVGYLPRFFDAYIASKLGVSSTPAITNAMPQLIQEIDRGNFRPKHMTLFTSFSQRTQVRRIPISVTF